MDIAEEIPNAMNDEFNYEVKEILSNIHYTNRFFEKIKGNEWAVYLFNKGYFDDVFSKGELNDFSLKKIEWLSNNVITDDIKLFTKLCYEKDFILSKSLQNEIASIICKREIGIDKIKILINLIDFYEMDFFFTK